MKTMRLDTLIAGMDLSLARGNAATPVIRLTDDSRQVKAGTLFVARDARYIAAAVEAGASAIVSDQPPVVGLEHLAWVRGANIDQRLAGRLAQRFHGEPAAKLALLAVTGTNGKTTTAFIMQHLLRSAGMTCGLIGTVCIDDGRTRRPAELTTPGAIELAELFAGMVANGCTAAVMETSSHALAQGRTDALQFDAAIFTNLTGDHLDYHATMDEYLAAKKILFDRLAPSATAVVNSDDAYATRILADCAAKVLRCSFKQPADCRATIHASAADSSRVTFAGPWGKAEVNLPLPGGHNVMNAMQALAAVQAVVPEVDPQALSRCPGVPGRLERVAPAHSDDPTVLVDYAHTHDALENVLRALRPITRGRLRVLFGCGGDRDRTKRPKMAAVACALADDVVITSDNPRTEQPDDIIREILAGVPRDRSAVQVEPDRAKAIASIITAAGTEDVVLLAGKGHEDYQIIGKTKRHFDDREQAAAALAARQRVTT